MPEGERVRVLPAGRVQVQVLPLVRERHVQRLRHREVLHRLQPQHDPWWVACVIELLQWQDTILPVQSIMNPRLCKYLQSLIVATIIISYLRRPRGPKGALESHFYQRLEKLATGKPNPFLVALKLWSTVS